MLLKLQHITFGLFVVKLDYIPNIINGNLNRAMDLLEVIGLMSMIHRYGLSCVSKSLSRIHYC